MGWNILASLVAQCKKTYLSSQGGATTKVLSLLWSGKMWGYSHSHCTGRVRVVSCPRSVSWLLCICDFFVAVGTFFSELGGSYGVLVQCLDWDFGDPMIWLVHEATEPIPRMLTFGETHHASCLTVWPYSKQCSFVQTHINIIFRIFVWQREKFLLPVCPSIALICKQPLAYVVWGKRKCLGIKIFFELDLGEQER